mgnify:CR=1 FL=1
MEATTTLKPATLIAITEKLRERDAQLVEELRQYGKFVDFGRGEDENAAEIAQYADGLSMEGELVKALRDVKNALSRLKAGTYGVCRYCNQPIAEKRLLARPTSSSCVACKMEKKAQ